MANPTLIPRVRTSLGRITPEASMHPSFSGDRRRVFCLFGTRPEVIKLAPVIRDLKRAEQGVDVRTICSGQHSDLLNPLLDLFDLSPDHHLDVMQPRQTPNEVCARVLERLGPIVAKEAPELMIVQGDTTTALAGALTAFHHTVPVAHVEAGLRSGNPESPFPEEMNRRLITRLATYHFAATSGNREALLDEGVPEASIFITGNPVVDSLQHILRTASPSERIRPLLDRISGSKLVVLTTHRRENFGDTMRQNLRALREFVETREDVTLVFAVHPNPNVVEEAQAELSGHSRILLIAPLDYPDFLQLLLHAWLVVSDSGGIQEEAPSLGKPLLVLRNNTERKEAVEAGAAVLVGDEPGRLTSILKQVYIDSTWIETMRQMPNPFGDGMAARRIANVISSALHRTQGRNRGISR
jgi:UDP-N-acetylglucosamine 2-epimerase (non-hydrolysing)